MRWNMLIGMVTVAVFGSGCAQKMQVRVLEPAEVDRAASTKKIAVTAFTNDQVDLSGKIEAELSQQKVDGSTFFTLSSRSDLNKILKEQKVQNSGLMDPSTAVEVGQLIGAQALISGTLSSPSMQDTTYYTTRVECTNKDCSKTRTYKVRCTKRVAALSAQLRMVDVTQGDIIYADTLSKHAEWSHCLDDSQAMPSREMAAQHLAGIISREFSYKLTPHYRSFQVELLEDPDLDYTDAQEKTLKYALEYIDQGRLDKAERLLGELIMSTLKQSYVPFYNLGVIMEAQGKYDVARNYYHSADDLCHEPVDQISAAVVRIDRVIERYNQTQEQLSR